MDTPQTTGFCYPCEVRQTPDKGLGVFSTGVIPKGAIVWRHVKGEFDVYDETAFRAKIAGMTEDEARHELTHVFGQDEFPGCLIRVHDAGVLINHADDANVDTNNKTALEGAPLLLSDPAEVAQMLLTDRYALIATRDIASGEELTNNYITDETDPPYYDELCDAFGVEEEYLDDT